MTILSVIYSFFFWLGVLSLVPYLALVAYGAYGCPEQDLKKKYNATW